MQFWKIIKWKQSSLIIKGLKWLIVRKTNKFKLIIRITTESKGCVLIYCSLTQTGTLGSLNAKLVEGCVN
jgi:hypothetical protein